MNRLLVESVIFPDPGGPTYLRPADPTHIMLVQDFAHQHIEALARAALVGGATEPTVAGFGFTLMGGLNLTIAAGHAVDADGLSYEASDETEITLAPAHATQPRIDLVYALLTPNVETDNEFIFMKRQLTEEEAAQNPPPVYEPTQINVPTRLRNQAVIQVRQGVQAANPVAPVANANEAPLFEVRVPASAANLVNGNVTDTRNLFYSLNRLGSDYLAFVAGINETIDARLNSTLQVAPNTGLLKSYDNPANTLTLSGVAATTVVMGMMSAADKSKLNGIAAGAQVNVLESVTGAAPIMVAALAGKNQQISISAATAVAAGSMSAADKAKLDAATNGNTANAIVRRDANGNFNAGVMRLMAEGVAGVGLGTQDDDHGLRLMHTESDHRVLMTLRTNVVAGAVKFSVGNAGLGNNSPDFRIYHSIALDDWMRYRIDGLGRTFLYGLVTVAQDDRNSVASLTVEGPVTCTVLNQTSDREAKTDFTPVDSREVLESLAALNVSGWRFRSEPESVRHIGPVAQDFRRAFGLGTGDKYIATVDVDGVLMASVQGLYQMVRELTAEVSRLRRGAHE